MFTGQWILSSLTLVKFTPASKILCVLSVRFGLVSKWLDPS